MKEMIRTLSVIVFTILLIPFAASMFTQPDQQIANIYNPQELNRYTFEKNSPYSYTDPSGKAAVWIHYSDTFRAYYTAGFSLREANRVALGAIEPDLYRVSQAGGLFGWATDKLASATGLDLEMEHEGVSAELYYHEGKDEEGNSIDQEEDYSKAIAEGDLEKAGNIEHALGHDVGSGGVAGYHSTEIGGEERSRFSHYMNDVFSTDTDRAALNQVQAGRAQSAYQTYSGSSSSSQTTSTTSSSTQKQTFFSRVGHWLGI